jgi:hypothetical protein
MKVSSSDDDTLIIQCERFEAGKEPFSLPVPTSIELVYLFFLMIIFYFSGFNLLKFLTELQLTTILYGKNHHLETIVCGFTFTLLIIEFGNNIFFKRVFIRKEKTYRIDRKSCVLPHPGYNYHQNMMTPDKNIVETIDSIDIEGTDNVSIRVSDYYDSDINGFPSWAEITYKVVIKFKSGESSTIESNSVGLGSCNDNQIAFRELMTETQAAVAKIKSFLAASKNEITPSSN